MPHRLPKTANRLDSAIPVELTDRQAKSGMRAHVWAFTESGGRASGAINHAMELSSENSLTFRSGDSMPIGSDAHRVVMRPRERRPGVLKTDAGGMSPKECL